jgi:hypothetical protein
VQKEPKNVATRGRRQKCRRGTLKRALRKAGPD